MKCADHKCEDSFDHFVACARQASVRHAAAMAMFSLASDNRWGPGFQAKCVAWTTQQPAVLDIRSLVVSLRLASGELESVAVLGAVFGGFRHDACTEAMKWWGVPAAARAELRSALRGVLFNWSHQAWCSRE